MPKSDIGRKLRFFAPVMGPGRNIAITFCVEKLEWCGYPVIKKIRRQVFFASTDYTNVTDRRTDGHRTTAYRPRLYMASRGKSRTFLPILPVMDC